MKGQAHLRELRNFYLHIHTHHGDQEPAAHTRFGRARLRRPEATKRYRSLLGDCSRIKLNPTRPHRVRPRTDLRYRRRPLARMAPRNQILHYEPSHMGRRDHKHSGVAHCLHCAGSARSHHSAWRMDILLSQACYSGASVRHQGDDASHCRRN